MAKQQRRYTKDDIKFVIENWGKMGVEEMAKNIGRSPSAIPFLAKRIRESGYPLPKLASKSLLKNIIQEALAEMGLKKGA